MVTALFWLFGSHPQIVPAFPATTSPCKPICPFPSALATLSDLSPALTPVSHAGSTLLSHRPLQSPGKSRHTLCLSLSRPFQTSCCPFTLVPNKDQPTNALAVFAFRELVTMLRLSPGPDKPRLVPCSATLSSADCHFSSPVRAPSQPVSIKFQLTYLSKMLHATKPPGGLD